ncbi:MAG: NAD(P)/FAD-dependent oxidoreductase [Hyphomicrobiales bacterium]
MGETADIVVIGAGIAGASVAMRLADEFSVIILEAEDAPGYHSTGRSAAMWVPEYGPPEIRALTKASGAFFQNRPDGFSQADILSPRGELIVALDGQEELLAEQAEIAPHLHELNPLEVAALVPLVRAVHVIGGLHDDTAQEIDVDALLQGFLRTFRHADGKLVCSARVGTLAYDGAWKIGTPAGEFSAPVIVNAAGAWGDVVAQLAGVEPVGLVPKRRSAALVPLPDEVNASAWPLTIDAAETVYFKPSSGQLIVSPADETPVEPHDAWAEDITIAEAIDQFQKLVDVEVTRVNHTWAGLRTFPPDGNPVVGYDREAEGFFWLVGQGGYGIQTSPALSQTAAALLKNQPVPAEIESFGVCHSALNPNRFEE